MKLNEIMDLEERERFQRALGRISRNVVRTFRLKSSMYHSPAVHGHWQAWASLTADPENKNAAEWDEVLLRATWPVYLKKQLQKAYPKMVVTLTPVKIGQSLESLPVMSTGITLSSPAK